MSRRGAFLFTLVAALVIAGTGTYCFLHGKGFVYRFTEAELNKKLLGYFPIEKKYLLVFHVTLNNPRFSLPEGADRIQAGIDLVLNIWVDREHLDVHGIPEKYAPLVRTALTEALAQQFANHPIYSLSRTNSKEVLARLVLKSVIVKNRELVVTLGI